MSPHEEDNTRHLPQHSFQKRYDNYKINLDSHGHLNSSAILTVDTDNISDLFFLISSLGHNYTGPNSSVEFDITLQTTNNVKSNLDASLTQSKFHEISSIMKQNEINDFEQAKSAYVDPQNLTLRDHTTNKSPESLVSHKILRKSLVWPGTPPPSPLENFLSAADSDQNYHIFEPAVQYCSALNPFELHTQASGARDLPPPGPPPTVPLPAVPGN